MVEVSESMWTLSVRETPGTLWKAATERLEEVRRVSPTTGEDGALNSSLANLIPSTTRIETIFREM